MQFGSCCPGGSRACRVPNVSSHGVEDLFLFHHARDAFPSRGARTTAHPNMPHLSKGGDGDS
jgi:hypothetical protein